MPLLLERVLKEKNISQFPNTVVEDVKIQDKLTLICRNKDSIRWNATISYLLIAVGREPALDFLDNDIDINRLRKMGRLYLIGDVKNGIYRQVGITVGDGIKTAMEIARENRREMK